LTSKSTARENISALVARTHLAPALINRSVVLERIGIDVKGALSQRRIGGVHVHAFWIALGFRVVGPDRIPAVVSDQAIVRLLINERPGRGVERVIKMVDAARGRRWIEGIDRVESVEVVELARKHGHTIGPGLI